MSTICMSKFKYFIDGLSFIWSNDAMELYGNLFGIFFLVFLILMFIGFLSDIFDK